MNLIIYCYYLIKLLLLINLKLIKKQINYIVRRKKFNALVQDVFKKLNFVIIFKYSGSRDLKEKKNKQSISNEIYYKIINNN